MRLWASFDRNRTGRDFVVGDVHGCFGLLSNIMTRVQFDETRDRMFSVGDLVDRGPSSRAALYWLAKPWFHAVRGNHEQMAIDAALGRIDVDLHKLNGGEWFYRLTLSEQIDFSRVFQQMPLTIEVDTPMGLVGLLHAEPPCSDWRELVQELDRTHPDSPFVHSLLWGRDIVRGRRPFSRMENIDRVYCGHTPVAVPHSIGNLHYIDTGAVFGRSLSVIDLRIGDWIMEPNHG